MIKPQELRIGNLVRPSEKFKKLTGLPTDLWKPEKVKRIEVDFVWATHLSGAAYDSIEGIPLTEEWLLKFGFEKTKDNLKTYTFDYIEVYKQDDIWWIDLNNISVEVYFVHQFQNICFYYLGGEELTIKE